MLRTVAAAMLAAAAVWASGACSKSLDALAPFPCANDGTCPEGLACQLSTTGQVCATPLNCDPGFVPCNEKCVNLGVDDPDNCGTCGNACPSSGGCCNKTCADFATDADNCGGCGKACPNKKSCLGGQCACKPTDTVCAGDCADLQTDPLNCGACGHGCGNDACVGGVCQACPPQMTSCNGVCVLTTLDPSNCGGCGVTCAAGQQCNGGSCGCAPCGTIACPTCANAGWVLYCDGSTVSCCAPDHPFYCSNTAPGACWDIPIDCKAAVMCSDGNWHGCLPPGVFDCSSMSCK